jgi:L-iditol 2-dehydrogenase
MKVARLYSVGDIRLQDEPVPTPGLNEALVRVTSVGLCGSDLLWFREAGIGDARLARPLVLGHEFAGVTDAGQRVAVDPAIPCEECEYCRTGNPNLCTQLRFAGHGQEDGALREFVAWPKRYLFSIPDTVSDADGAMLEPLGVALHAVDLGKIQPGMRVGVFGCGPIGLLVIQVARLAGAMEVFVIEPLSTRLDIARGLDAREWTSGQEVDVAFECAGENGAVEDAIAAAKPGGRVVLIGIPANDRTSFPASVARRKGLTIKLVRRMKFTYPRAIQLVESGKVDVRSLVSHQFPLEQAQQAFTVAQRREGLKVIITP